MARVKSLKQDNNDTITITADGESSRRIGVPVHADHQNDNAEPVQLASSVETPAGVQKLTAHHHVIVDHDSALPVRSALIATPHHIYTGYPHNRGFLQFRIWLCLDRYGLYTG